MKLEIYSTDGRSVVTLVDDVRPAGRGALLALGARPLVTHILAGHALRQALPEGRSVEVAGRSGVVERVGPVDTVFRDGNQKWSMSTGALLEEVIVR